MVERSTEQLGGTGCCQSDLNQFANAVKWDVGLRKPSLHRSHMGCAWGGERAEGSRAEIIPIRRMLRIRNMASNAVKFSQVGLLERKLKRHWVVAGDGLVEFLPPCRQLRRNVHIGTHRHHPEQASETHRHGEQCCLLGGAKVHSKNQDCSKCV